MIVPLWWHPHLNTEIRTLLGTSATRHITIQLINTKNVSIQACHFCHLQRQYFWHMLHVFLIPKCYWSISCDKKLIDVKITHRSKVVGDMDCQRGGGNISGELVRAIERCLKEIKYCGITLSIPHDPTRVQVTWPGHGVTSHALCRGSSVWMTESGEVSTWSFCTRMSGEICYRMLRYC